MGQLEKYGLYVLCLLIFLIFGVTLWGAPEVNAGRKDANGKQSSTQLAVNGPAGTGANPSNPAAGQQGRESAVGQPGTTMGNLLGLDQPPKAGAESKPKPAGGAAQGDPAKGDSGKGSGSAEPHSDPKDGGAAPKADPRTDAGAPVQRQTHRVGAGDSFTSIAIQYFKDAGLADDIARLNPKLDPRRLQLKTEVVLPTKEEVAAIQQAKKSPKAGDPKAGDPKEGAKAAPAAGDEYEVRSGDTFEGISIRVFGTRNRVDDIKKLNPGVTPTNMKIGSKLKLPKK